VVCGQLVSGETVLVTGASGGVGSAAVTLGAALGARVVALSRDAERRLALMDRGATAVVNAAAPDLDNVIKEALGAERPALTVENLGGPWLELSVRLSATGGRIMVIGLLAGLSSSIPLGLIIHKNLKIEGLSVGAYSAEEAQAAWTTIVETLQQAHQRPQIGCTVDFDGVQEGFSRMAQGLLGKVVVRVSAR
jgi:NADPH2:quinone reductase